MPAIDLAHLDRLRQLDEGDGFFETVVREFIRDAAQLVDELKAAAAAGDAVLFRDRAHALRSSAAHIGARALFEVCLEWRGISSAELGIRRRAIDARLTTELDRMRHELLRHGQLADPPVPRSAADAGLRRPLG